MNTLLVGLAALAVIGLVGAVFRQRRVVKAKPAPPEVNKATPVPKSRGSTATMLMSIDDVLSADEDSE